MEITTTTTTAEINTAWAEERTEGSTIWSRTRKIGQAVLTTARPLFIIAAPLAFQILMVTAQGLQPGYNPLRDTISSMVWGPQGWLQTSNFVIIGLMLAALAVELRPWAGQSLRARTGRLLLLLTGAGFALLAICPTQSPGGLKNLPAIVHGITVYGIVFFFPAACFLLAPVLGTGRSGRILKAGTLAVGAVELGLIGLGGLLMLNDAHWFGMLERLLLLPGFTWLEVVAVYFAGDSLINSIQR
jgi:hypothetical protein